MCRLMEEFLNDERADAKHSRDTEQALIMIKADRFTPEEISLYSGLPLNEVKKLSEGQRT